MQYIFYSILRAVVDAGFVLGIISFFGFCLVIIGVIIKVVMDALAWIFS